MRDKINENIPPELMGKLRSGGISIAISDGSYHNTITGIYEDGNITVLCMEDWTRVSLSVPKEAMVWLLLQLSGPININADPLSRGLRGSVQSYIEAAYQMHKNAGFPSEDNEASLQLGFSFVGYSPESLGEDNVGVGDISKISGF